jgi:hypothetical protein
MLQQYLPFQLVSNPPTANDVTTASIPSTAGATAIHRQQIQMAQLQVIPFQLYQPMEH